MTDPELLRLFVSDAEASNASFTQLVTRHAGLVYAAALRQTRSTALASDITQAVFLDLAKHARKLRADTHLPSWLITVARRTAIDAIRRESRQRVREQTSAELATVNTHDSTASPTSDLAPILDDALTSLSEPNRRAVLLRFFENQSFQQIARHLGATEASAQKRVSRALEKLRAALARRGIATTSAFLAAQLPLHGAITAPATLSATLTSPAFLTTATSAVPLGNTFIQTVLMTASKKSVLISALVLAAGFAVFEGVALANLNQQTAATELHTSRLQHEVALLKNQLAQKNTRPASDATPPAPADSLDASHRALLERAVLLQRLFEAMPEERIPELCLLTADDWLAVAADYPLTTPANADLALSQIRNKARHHFTPLLRSALQKFLLTSGDVLPETPSALRPYFDPPIDDAILARYEMARAGIATEAGPRGTVIREKKSATDNILDTPLHMAMMGTHYDVRERGGPRSSRLTPELLDSLRTSQTPAHSR